MCINTGGKKYKQKGKRDKIFHRSEFITMLRFPLYRIEIYMVNFRIPKHSPGQPELARNGHAVCFYHKGSGVRE
jgi:hypothetical protein